MMTNKLLEACRSGNLEQVKKIVGEGTDIHKINDYALTTSSSNGHLEVVKFLVEKGADIHAFNNEALRWADNNSRVEVVAFLKRKMLKEKLLTIN